MMQKGHVFQHVEELSRLANKMYKIVLNQHLKGIILESSQLMLMVNLVNLMVFDTES